MCFWRDDAAYDWIPDVIEEGDGPLDEGQRCDECNRWINAGEWCRAIFMQENDETDWDEEEDGEEFDPGQTEEYVRCEHCDKILRAIGQVEKEEGCRGRETRPELCRLGDALTGTDADNQDAYIARATHLFPEVASTIDYFVESGKPPMEEQWDMLDFEPVEVHGGEA